MQCGTRQQTEEIPLENGWNLNGTLSRTKEQCSSEDKVAVQQSKAIIKALDALRCSKMDYNCSPFAAMEDSERANYSAIGHLPKSSVEIRDAIHWVWVEQKWCRATRSKKMSKVRSVKGERRVDWHGSRRWCFCSVVLQREVTYTLGGVAIEPFIIIINGGHIN